MSIWMILRITPPGAVLPTRSSVWSSTTIRSFLRDQLCPAVEDPQDFVGICRRQAHCHASDTEIAVASQHREVLRRTSQHYRQRCRVVAGLLGYLAEARHEVFGATRAGARRGRQDAVAVADRSPRGETEGAADNDRRMRLLRVLGPDLHRRKVDDLAVILGGVLGPDLLHRFDLLPHLQRAGLVICAVFFHFLGVPAATDAEQEAASGYLVERGHELRGLDRVSLDHQANSGAELEP